MVQAGELFLLRSRELYNPVEGVPFKAYAFPFLMRTMKRVLYEELARYHGSSIRRFEMGTAVILRADVEEIDDFQGDAQGLTSIERLDLFTVKRAIWQAAHDNGDVYILWRYAFIRNCIFSERMTFAEFGRRYQKRPNSLYFLRDRLMRDARKILGLDDD